jgi:hypothetical protein
MSHRQRRDLHKHVLMSDPGPKLCAPSYGGHQGAPGQASPNQNQPRVSTDVTPTPVRRSVPTRPRTSPAASPKAKPTAKPTRCLKRYIAREIYPIITAPPQAEPSAAWQLLSPGMSLLVCPALPWAVARNPGCGPCRLRATSRKPARFSPSLILEDSSEGSDIGWHLPLERLVM